MFASKQPELTHIANGAATPVDFDGVAALWRRVLETVHVDADTHFFDAGGHALRAMEMLSSLRAATGVEVPLNGVYEHPTLAAFHRYLVGGSADVTFQSELPAHVVRLSRRAGNGTSPNLFCLYSGQRFRHLADALGDAAVVYAVTAPTVTDFVNERSEVMPRSIEGMATDHIAAIRAVQAHGPYSLAGFSFGGRIALETARQLRAAGAEVSLLAIVDTALGNSLRRRWFTWIWNQTRHMLDGGPAYLRLAWRMRRERLGSRQPADEENPKSRHVRRDSYLRQAVRDAHRPGPYDGEVLLFETTDLPEGYVAERGLGWLPIAKGGVDLHLVRGEHQAILAPPNVAAVADVMLQHLERYRIRRPPSGPVDT